MITVEELKSLILKAFVDVPPPPDWCIVESGEGDEPRAVQAAFAGIKNWRDISPEELDRAPNGLGSALSFFSDEAFRYYLQAYLIADLEGALESNDPVWHLTSGLTSEAKRDCVNCLRYGARTWWDASVYTFSVFTAEQAFAIASYLQYKVSAGDLLESDEASVAEALSNYWLSRCSVSP
ncbi:DUF6714 family protein [Cupriavidus metallidurans]|uniref:DUF6714 family protein n=1 Tax=Cupriavidus metallidurans TaxID=119219 RepID=UPI003D056558